MNKIILEDMDFVFNQLKNTVDLAKLKNASIFITGGTGLFGKLFLDAFLFLNYKLNLNIKITVLTRNYESFIKKYKRYIDKNIDFIIGDIRNFEIYNKNIDYCLHLAASVDPNLEKNNPNEMESVIVDGTKNLIKKLEKYSIKRLLFTSSGAVYGKQPDNIKYMAENFECNPNSIYGKSKLLAESILLNNNINCVIARCYALVGPYLNLNIHYAIGNFISDCLHKKDIIIKGDGTPLRSYLYTADLVLWLLTILLKSENKEIYNVGSMKEISIYQLAKIISEQFEYKTNIKVLSKENIGIAPTMYMPDNRKIISMLGVKENYKIESMIKKTILWNKEEFN